VGSIAVELVALLADVAPRLARITAFISIGVFAANVAVAFGLIRYVAGLSGWLTRPANLPDEVGTAILTTAASTTAGYATLAEYRESGLLDDRATLVAVVINTFFGFVQHVFTYYVPVLIPILGTTTGTLYVSARAGIALAITLSGVALGGLLLSERNVNREALADVEASGPDADDRGGRKRVRDAAGKSWKTLRRIVPRLAVVYTLVIGLITYYDVESLTGVAEPITALLGLPGAAVPVIAVYTLDTTAGAVTIAPLLDGHVHAADRGRDPAHRRDPLVCRLHVPPVDPVPVRDLGRGVRHEGDSRQHGAEDRLHLDDGGAAARARLVSVSGRS